MVVVEWYEYNFWWKSLEESMYCKPVHYCDAKTTSCLPKISFKTVLTDPLEMSRVSARSLIVNRRFLSTKSLISMTCCSSVDVFSRPGHSLSSTRSLPSLKIFYRAWSPKAFCNILNVSAAKIPFRTQNLMQLLWSTKSDIIKIEKNTFCCSQKRTTLLNQWRQWYEICHRCLKQCYQLWKKIFMRLDIPAKFKFEIPGFIRTQ